METYGIIDVIHHLSILLTALVFNIALCALVVVQGTKNDHGNRSFRDVVFVIPISNLITCVAYVINYADLPNVSTSIRFLFRILIYLSNMFVTFFFSRYIESYFGEKHGANPYLHLVNSLTMLIMTGVVVTYFLAKLPSVILSEVAPAAVNPIFRIVTGYVVELYYLIYAMVFYIRRKTLLPQRVQMTVWWSFFLTIFTIILEYITPKEFLVNYLGASIGLYLFYFGVETPDYRNLQQAMIDLEEERRRADEARKRADEANQSKSEFLANMSHEIRTPINAVLGMNEMILRESKDERITGYAHNVESAGKNLLSIINDILDFSKIEAGKIELIEGDYQLSSVINDVTNMISFKARKKGLAFEMDIDETLPDDLRGDEVRIRQIIVNILNNAVKYTEHGKVKLFVKMERPENEDDKKIILVVTVEDTGIGIRRADLDRLFRKFERVDLPRTKTIEGTGLGLAITQNLVSLMGGSIDVHSVYGEGSTFIVRIPQQTRSDEPIGDFHVKFEQKAKESEHYKEAFQAPNASLLVVDDTELNLQVVDTMLRRTKMKIDKALSGAEALMLTMEKHYDLILMDQRMPEMDGTHALFRIRQQTGGLNRATPVICLTADAVIGAKDRYIEKGFTDYLTKPIEGTSLEEMLSKYLPPEKVIRVADTTDEGGQADSNGQGSDLRDIYDESFGLNYEDAIHYQNNEEQLGVILRGFYEAIPAKSDEIEQLFSKGDYENYTIKVHALKSSARILGINDLSEKARKLEESGDKVLGGDMSEKEIIERDTPKLLAQYRDLITIFKPYFYDKENREDDTSDGKEPITEEALVELLKALKEFSSILDYDDMNEILIQTHEYVLPESERKRFEELEQAVNLLDSEKVMKLLEDV